MCNTEAEYLVFFNIFAVLFFAPKQCFLFIAVYCFVGEWKISHSLW